MLLNLGIVDFVCGLSRALFREISKYAPNYIATTGDNHLVIASLSALTVMVYMLRGQLVHEFGGRGSDPGRFNVPCDICVDDSGLVYVADLGNRRVQFF